MAEKDLMAEVMETMAFAGENAPNLQGKFMEFNKAVLGKGLLSVKQKELIAIALSLSSSCEWCITYHVKMALQNGASKAEIVEASYIAVLMSGAPALMHMHILKEALDGL
jgi:AhpD family alkylhydroperoxidase